MRKQHHGDGAQTKSQCRTVFIRSALLVERKRFAMCVYIVCASVCVIAHLAECACCQKVLIGACVFAKCVCIYVCFGDMCVCVCVCKCLASGIVGKA